ncbi:hypothetical protein JCM10207_003980 [Rhodosporidiobolus poonsookiae]
MPQKLSPDGRRIRTIIITAPFVVASSILLYKRLVLGEEQRHLPRPVRGVSVDGRPMQQPLSGPGKPSEKREDGFEGMPADVAARIREAEERAKR